MKTRKFILLNLFIFTLSIIACSTTKGTAYRNIMLLDKPANPAVLQMGVTQGHPPGYTALFKDPPNANALVAVLP